MKKLTQSLAVVFSLALSVTLAHAEEKECDTAMHNQKNAGVEKCDSPMHNQKHAKAEKCDTPTHNMQHTAMSGDIFSEADTNHDGAVSKKEFNAYYTKHNAKHFSELDANHDGKLTANEMQGNPPPQPPVATSGGTAHLDNRFAAADANHDGGLDKEEAVNMPMLSKYYDEVDSNHDGKVTRQEYFDAMPILHGAKNIPIGGSSQSM
jgi:EF hand